MIPDLPSQAGSSNERLERTLQTFLVKRPFVLQASVIAGDGSIMASVLCSGCSPPRSQALQVLLHELAQSYPRQPLKRLIIEDALGTVVAARTNDHQVLVVITEPDAKLGAVSMTVEQLLRNLK